jgi:uncharacterized OsmC-like protein
VVGDRLGVNLAGMTVRVEKQLRSEPPRRIESFAVILHLPASVPEEARGELEAAAGACPVRNSLHPEIGVDLRVCYDVPRPAAAEA